MKDGRLSRLAIAGTFVLALVFVAWSASVLVAVARHGSDPSQVVPPLRSLTHLVWIGCLFAVAVPLLLLTQRRARRERRRAGAALQKAERSIGLCLDQMPGVLWSTDRDLRITNSIGTALAGLDLRPQEVVGMTLFEYFETDDPASPLIAPQLRALAGEPVTFAAEWKGRHYRARVEPLRRHDGAIVGTQGVALDVTAQKLAEDELHRARTLESLGLFAGGIAHDFNNILMSAAGEIAAARALLDPESEAAAGLVDAERTIVRAGELSQRLLAFARGDSSMLRTCSIAKLVREAVGLALSGSPVRCELELPADLWPVDMDESQIAQVVHNLAVNAGQAMAGGGRLRVAAANVELDEGSGVPLPAGRYVRIAFVDEGVGIPPENLRKVFDPHFTTKQTGSGLGLATSCAIVRRHEGHLAAASRPGEGATFTIHLPASADLPAA